MGGIARINVLVLKLLRRSISPHTLIKMRLYLIILTIICGSLTARQPNIILILSDDHGYADMSHTEYDTGVDTPHLDRLAAEGIRFTNAYATSPICTPSRIGLVLGQYQQRYDNWWYNSPGLPERDIAPTMAEILQDEGYATCLIGKIHFNANFGLHLRNHPLNHGFDRFYGFNGPAKHYLVHNKERHDEFMAKLRKHEPDRHYLLMFMEPMWDDRKQVDVEGFSTDLFRDETIRFIDDHRDEPFFIMLSFNAVHDQTHQLPPEYLKEQGIPIPDDWDPGLESSSEWINRTFSEELNRAFSIGHLYYMDEAIGRIMEHLDNTGLREDTLIVYTVDNGGSVPTGGINTPLSGSKFTVLEGGLRTPFIVSWPGSLEQGKILDNVVSAMDLMPTFASLAGAEIPEDTDGLNILPLLKGENTDIGHETLFWDMGHWNQFAVRHGDWKLRFSEPAPRQYRLGEKHGFYLHNLSEDIGEKVNLIEEHPEKVSELNVLHRQWIEEILRNLP